MRNEQPKSITLRNLLDQHYESHAQINVHMVILKKLKSLLVVPSRIARSCELTNIALCFRLCNTDVQRVDIGTGAVRKF